MGDSFLSWVARTLQCVPEVNKYKHDPEAFTQGLLWSNGSLFESTGLYGRSSLRELQLGSRGSFAACSSYSRFMVLLYYDGLLIYSLLFSFAVECSHSVITWAVHGRGQGNGKYGLIRMIAFEMLSCCAFIVSTSRELLFICGIDSDSILEYIRLVGQFPESQCALQCPDSCHFGTYRNSKFCGWRRLTLFRRLGARS